MFATLLSRGGAIFDALSFLALTFSKSKPVMYFSSRVAWSLEQGKPSSTNPFGAAPSSLSEPAVSLIFEISTRISFTMYSSSTSFPRLKIVLISLPNPIIFSSWEEISSPAPSATKAEHMATALSTSLSTSMTWRLNFSESLAAKVDFPEANPPTTATLRSKSESMLPRVVCSRGESSSFDSSEMIFASSGLDSQATPTSHSPLLLR